MGAGSIHCLISCKKSIAVIPVANVTCNVIGDHYRRIAGVELVTAVPKLVQECGVGSAVYPSCARLCEQHQHPSTKSLWK